MTSPLSAFVGAAGVIVFALWFGNAAADAPGPHDPLTTLACHDREDPGAGATLVLDLARRRLVNSSNIGDTILFDNRDLPVRVDAAAIEWEVAHNTYTLNRATLELDVIGRVYLCQLAKRQL
jgi:hypothetical protein